METEEPKKVNDKDQVAVPVSCDDVSSAEYVSEQGWSPSFIRLDSGHQIARVKLIAIVVSVSEEQQAFVVDDGSGTLVIRNPPWGDKPVISPGDTIMIIGRVRDYGSERHVAAEIMKVIYDARWLNVHRKLIRIIRNMTPALESAESKKGSNQPEQSDSASASQSEDKVQDVPAAHQTASNFSEDEPDEYSLVLDTIRKLDSGNGASVSDVAAKSGVAQSERIIKSLLEQGEIFELKKGMLKILE